MSRKTPAPRHKEAISTGDFMGQKSRHPKLQKISVVVSPDRPWVLCFFPFSLRWLSRLACTLLVLLLPRATGVAPSISQSEAARPPPGTPTTLAYSTVLGEHRRIPLPDGSTVELNSDSRISITFTPDLRSVDLTQGEALFHVAHEKRPFRVSSGRSIIEDIATAFDVYKKPHSILVSVLDGRIRIYTKTGAALHSSHGRGGNNRAGSNVPPTEFHQGEQIEVPEDSDAAPHLRATLSLQELSRLTAWSQGRVEFAGERLGDAVEEFSRYHVEKFKFADNVIPRLRVGGSINTSSLEDFLVMLRLEFNIGADKSIEADGTTVITLAFIDPTKALDKRSRLH